MPRRYAVLDVFADRPLAGNPLAVVLDADGLDDAGMQAIAREFNLSETVFVQPAANPVHRASLRIFTPGQELPFAGHPTVGTAVLLALDAAGANPGRREMMLVLEEKVGPVRCGATVKNIDAGHAIFDIPRLPAESPLPRGEAAVAGAVGLDPVEIGFENHRLSAFGAGVDYVFVPVRDRDVIARAKPVAAIWKETFGGRGAYLYCRDTEIAGHHFHARMFAPHSGINEDPATGSAVAALPGVILRFDEPPAGSHRYVIEQGFEMGRPSLIGLEVDLDGGAVVAARIGGDAVVVARGELSV